MRPDTGVFLRIAHRFQNRFVEWLAAFQVMFLGLILLADGNTFQTASAYFYLERVAPENVWGCALFFVGTCRLMGLIINGARQEVTPWIRATGAIFGFMVFTAIAVGMAIPWLLGNPPVTGLAMYPPAACAELVALYYSMRDAKVYWNGKRTAT